MRGKKPSICGWHGKPICDKCNRCTDCGEQACKCDAVILQKSVEEKKE